MRSLLLCLLACVVLGADLDYREVIHKDGTRREGWWDPVTSVLHLSDDRRIWYDKRDTVARTRLMPAPDNALPPTKRSFSAEPIRYARLVRTDREETLGPGWLISGGDRFVLYGRSPFPTAGSHLQRIYREEMVEAPVDHPRPPEIEREAYRIAVEAGVAQGRP